jgi:hypothetical protein
MHSETLLMLFLPVRPLVPIRLANAAAQLPYGSGKTKGVLLLRSQVERKAATLCVI